MTWTCVLWINLPTELSPVPTSNAWFILCPANASAMRIWSKFDITTSAPAANLQESWAQLNPCKIFVANFWRQHSYRNRICRKYEPGLIRPTLAVSLVCQHGWIPHLEENQYFIIWRSQVQVPALVNFILRKII